MRQILLDTETTGLDARSHRVIEIGCVELVERRPSGRVFHRYLNPQREVDRGAAEVHGLTDEFLADKPLFAQVVAEFLAFIDGAELIIHNAAFDLGFLDSELARLDGRGKVQDRCTVEDTLLMARKRYPGQRNSLDALCKRLDINNAHRTLHGALLDAQLLLDVYLAMTSGQGEMGFDIEATAPVAMTTTLAVDTAAAGMRPRVQVQPDEAEAHTVRLAGLQKKSGRCVWLALEDV
jgi:DNA polymerase-3 subunit epsilon